MSIIIGIHMGHDASVTVLRDGRPVFCLSEERLARLKMYYGFPYRAFELALSQEQIDPAAIDVLALDTQELPQMLGPEEMTRRFKRGAARDFSQNLIKGKKVISYFLGRKAVEKQAEREESARQILLKELSAYGFRDEAVRVYDHHLGHAASAFWPSPFAEALFVTSDGRGDSLSATIGLARDHQLIRQATVSDLDSIGQFYSAVTFILGFRPNRHEGKITGLAAHGDPYKLGKVFQQNLEWKPDGSYSFRVPEKYLLADLDDFDDFLKRMPLSLKDRIILHGLDGLNNLLYTSNWYSLIAYLQDVTGGCTKEDIAAGVQYLTEVTCTSFVARHLPERPIPVVLAGGVFSNVRVNQEIRELQGVTNVYVQPAMGDAGLSLGAALLAYAESGKEQQQSLASLDRPSKLDNVYLGPNYSRDDILAACREEDVAPVEMENTAVSIADWINRGLIVGYYQGAMEFGPRALGHRSILARPTDRQINTELNHRLKRTEFMPFAPSMLAEHAPEYLRGYQPDHVASEYMTITYHIPEHLRENLQAVVHVDGTARPQVVHAEKEPAYHNIISAYQKLSGLPVIINTSFNMHEEPIVCSPEDAIRSYKSNCVDILVMEDIAIGAEKARDVEFGYASSLEGAA